MRSLLFVATLSLIAAGCSEDDPAGQLGPDAAAGGDDIIDAGSVVDSNTGSDPVIDGGDDPVDSDGGLGLACSADDLGPIFECAAENCLDLGGGFDLDGGIPSLDGGLPGGGGFDTDELLVCITTSCFADILTLPPECSQCIFAAAAGGDVADACGLGGGGFPTP